MNKKKIEDYIGVAKTDIIFYVILTVVFLIILLILGHIYKFYYGVLFDIFMIIFTYFRVVAYYNLKKIYNHLNENDLLYKIGSIDYWNEKNFFLTENYMILKERNEVLAFKYNKIKEIYKSVYRRARGSHIDTYLHVVLDGSEFKVLIYTTVLADCDYRDISDYLLKKNPNIVVLDTVKKKK